MLVQSCLEVPWKVKVKFIVAIIISYLRFFMLVLKAEIKIALLLYMMTFKIV